MYYKEAPVDHRYLHPNLARMAAAYDDIMERFARNQITKEDARYRISNLVSRDDQGVQWCISPDDGQWYRQTVGGRLVKDTPPQAGVGTYSGWELSGGGDPLSDPRLRVVDNKVDPRSLTDPHTLAGSTSRVVRGEADDNNRASKNIWWFIVFSLFAIIAVVAIYMATREPAGESVQVGIAHQALFGTIFL